MTNINITPDDQKVFDRFKSTGRITHSLRHLMTNQWNKCCVCSRVIPKGRPTFAGYDADGNPMFVGACCANYLVELATPTYWGVTDTLNIAVDDEQPLWRYMEFSKFIAMLSQGGLYFPSAAEMEDKFEGATGLARREADWNNFYLDYFRKIVVMPPEGYPKPKLTQEEIERKANDLLKQFKAAGSRHRSDLISCWHANTVESEALWRLYCPPPVVGVAVRTTAGALWTALAEEPHAIIGKVHYLDYEKTFSNINDRIFCKRLSLSHENEVRAVIRRTSDRSEGGRLVKCELSHLIDAVVVSPFAPRWFESTVKDVIERFSYNFSTHPSRLLDEPFY